jgi:hypothetical protein
VVFALVINIEFASWIYSAVSEFYLLPKLGLSYVYIVLSLQKKTKTKAQWDSLQQDSNHHLRPLWPPELGAHRAYNQGIYHIAADFLHNPGAGKSSSPDLRQEGLGVTGDLCHTCLVSRESAELPLGEFQPHLWECEAHLPQPSASHLHQTA